MTTKPKLTDLDVVLAFEQCSGLRTKFPIDILIESHSPKAARRAIIHAVCRGLIDHNGDPERGRLSEAGKALLASTGKS